MAKKHDPAIEAAAAELKESDRTRAAAVDAAFEERYGDARWQERILKSPQSESQLRSLIETEMDLDEVRGKIAELAAAGEDTWMMQAPNGVVGRHPLRAELQALEGIRKNLCRSLKLDLSVKDSNKTNKSKVSQIASA